MFEYLPNEMRLMTDFGSFQGGFQGDLNGDGVRDRIPGFDVSMFGDLQLLLCELRRKYSL